MRSLLRRLIAALQSSHSDIVLPPTLQPSKEKRYADPVPTGQPTRAITPQQRKIFLDNLIRETKRNAS
jgi:hypothetical protein